MADIRTVGVIGGGTMGAGIAGACALAGCDVLLLEVNEQAAQAARERVLATAQDDAERSRLRTAVRTGTTERDANGLADCDWIVEAVIEELDAKRRVFALVEAHRKPGSVVTSNTSGILLADIAQAVSPALRRDMLVTHFFNPVRVMRLVEVVPGAETDAAQHERIKAFCRDTLGKGVVDAKDTVSFVGNRIGCFWMLSGLHKAKPFLGQGLTQESVDALMGSPVGLPPTGLYGLIDLIGLDVMDGVGKTLRRSLPEDDPARAFAAFPPAERAMLERGQLGRKSGGGFYRLIKLPDGAKQKEVFDLTAENWREAQKVRLDQAHADAAQLFFADAPEGKFAWDLMGGTMLYAAGLVPEIADDIVNVDRALRWGYAWSMGPFELLDKIGPMRVIERLERQGMALPGMLRVLKDAKAEQFYDSGRYLGTDGHWHPMPVE